MRPPSPPARETPNAENRTVSDQPSQTPENDVYTVLVILATVLVAGATVFLAVRSQQLFGSWNPFGGA